MKTKLLSLAESLWREENLKHGAIFLKSCKPWAPSHTTPEFSHPALEYSLGFFIKHSQGLGENGKGGAKEWGQRDVAEDGVQSSQQGRAHGNQGFWGSFLGAELVEGVQEQQQELEERGQFAKGLLFLLSPVRGCLGSWQEKIPLKNWFFLQPTCPTIKHSWTLSLHDTLIPKLYHYINSLKMDLTT